MQEPRQQRSSTIRSPKGNPSGSPLSCSRVGEAWHCARASASPQSRSPKALRGLAPQDGHVSDPAANLARPQSPWLPDNVISYPTEKLGLQMATSRARELSHTRPEVVPWWAASGPQSCGERDAALQRAPQAGDCSPGTLGLAPNFAVGFAPKKHGVVCRHNGSGVSGLRTEKSGSRLPDKSGSTSVEFNLTSQRLAGSRGHAEHPHPRRISIKPSSNFWCDAKRAGGCPSAACRQSVGKAGRHHGDRSHHVTAPQLCHQPQDKLSPATRAGKGETISR